MIEFGEPGYFFSFQGYLDRAYETLGYVFFIPEERRVDTEKIIVKLQKASELIDEDMIYSVLVQLPEVETIRDLTYGGEDLSLSTRQTLKVLIDSLLSMHYRAIDDSKSGDFTGQGMFFGRLVDTYVRIIRLMIDELCHYCKFEEYSLSADKLSDPEFIENTISFMLDLK